MATIQPEALLRAWFGDDLDTPAAVAQRAVSWFFADPALDDLLRERFGSLPDVALAGGLSAWRDAPRSTLALVLVLDQLPRNLYRGTAQAFAYDAEALDLARWALARGIDGELHPVESAFLCLPFEHSEDRADQVRCIALFRALLARAPGPLTERFEGFLHYAERHQAVIDRFGRFPHRNALLGRESTPEELRYLEDGGDTF